MTQFGEDAILRGYLPGVRRGRYVDVGANHPEQDSISWPFYCAGWSGITVEPVPELAALHRELRPRDVCVQAACGAVPTTAVLHTAAPTYGLSTLRHDYAPTPHVDIEVPVVPLDAILEAHRWQDRPIHFVTIDVEGYELWVLMGFDLDRWRPWLLVIESTVPNRSDLPTYGEWEPLVTKAGYRLVEVDPVNRYYQREEVVP
jgi:FkbM family methyltransferase